ncbi:MAG: TetR/AcrR family transcriptional regulator [Spirochaetaceae bacterium]|jgi:AcrR family transcriptional regulator|nr:TetR/AcrR family transcriptional regulator [Spirochaetaceae bacterium]
MARTALPADQKAGNKRCPRKPTSRQIRAQTSRARIYETAVALIRKNGYDNTSISDICGEAGISTGAFYHYFKSKHEILSELYIRADHFFESYMATRKERKNSVEEAKDYMAVYIHFVTLDGLNNGMDMCRNLYTPKNELFVKEGRLMQTLLEDLIQQGQEKKEISLKFTPHEWVNFLFTVLRGIVFDWVLRSGVYDIDAYAKFHIECLGNYLLY